MVSPGVIILCMMTALGTVGVPTPAHMTPGCRGTWPDMPIPCVAMLVRARLAFDGGMFSCCCCCCCCCCRSCCSSSRVISVFCSVEWAPMIGRWCWCDNSNWCWEDGEITVVWLTAPDNNNTPVYLGMRITQSCSLVNNGRTESIRLFNWKF